MVSNFMEHFVKHVTYRCQIVHRVWIRGTGAGNITSHGLLEIGNQFAFCSPTAGRRTKINYPISPNPWEVIFPAPVDRTSNAQRPPEWS